jgi:hypothetical protein
MSERLESYGRSRRAEDFGLSQPILVLSALGIWMGRLLVSVLGSLSVVHGGVVALNVVEASYGCALGISCGGVVELCGGAEKAEKADG